MLQGLRIEIPILVVQLHPKPCNKRLKARRLVRQETAVLPVLSVHPAKGLLPERVGLCRERLLAHLGLVLRHRCTNLVKLGNSGLDGGKVGIPKNRPNISALHTSGVSGSAGGFGASLIPLFLRCGKFEHLLVHHDGEGNHATVESSLSTGTEKTGEPVTGPIVCL